MAIAETTYRRRDLFARRRAWAGALLALPAVVFVLVFFFAPLCLMGWMSLNSWPLVGKIRYVGLDNYFSLFQDPTFLGALAVSLEFVLVATPLTVIFGLLLALLVRKQRPGVAVFRGVFFLPLVIGFAPAAYIWLWLLNPDVGLLGRLLHDVGIAPVPIQWLAMPATAFLAAVTLFIWKTVGFSMLLLMGGLQAVPNEIVEAASIDGAGRLRRFLSIELPIMRRTVALVLVFSLVGSFLVFEPFFILTRGGPGASTTGIVQWIFSTSFFNFRLGLGAAASFVLLALLLFFTGLQLRALRGNVN